jgi:hypothetical protein
LGSEVDHTGGVLPAHGLQLGQNLQLTGFKSANNSPKQSVMQLAIDRKEKFLVAPGWLTGAWNKDGHHGYWHIEHPHVVIAHIVGIGGQHQHGKKIAFKV